LHALKRNFIEKTTSIEKFLSLKNYFLKKNYQHWKTTFIEKHCFHWKMSFIQKLTCIEKIICIEFTLNANWNEELNLFWTRQIQNFRFCHMHNCFNCFLSIVNNTCLSLVAMEPQKNLVFESLILNDKRYNEHHLLEKWWHSLHDNL